MEFEKALNCFSCSLASPVFCFLNPDETARIEKNRIEVEFKPGETIIKSGTPITHVMSFHKGLAKMAIENQKSKDFILEFITPHTFFSDPGLLTDFTHRFTVTAIERCTLCLIEVDTFLDVMKGNSKMMFAYMENSNSFILHLVNKMEGLLVKHQLGLMADALIYLSQKIYKSNPFKLSISRKDLGLLTGLSGESVSRVLHQFSNEGLVQIKGKYFHILNLDMLEQISIKG